VGGVKSVKSVKGLKGLQIANPDLQLSICSFQWLTLESLEIRKLLSATLTTNSISDGSFEAPRVETGRQLVLTRWDEAW